jgi:cytoskeletal protein CcmA (bactofilin family)
VVVAGGSVSAPGRVGGALRIIGGDIDMTGAADGEVSAAGGSVMIDGRVGRALQAAGGEVRIGPRATIAGDARLGGGEIVIEGRIDGTLHVAADQVFVNGSVGGDVSVRARRITIGPQARLEGALRWRARSPPQTAPGAAIAGEISGAPMREEEAPGIGDMARQALNPALAWAAGAAWTVAWALMCFVIGALVAWAAPGVLDRVRLSRDGRWAAALGWGAALAAAPILGALAAIASLIGMPLGVAIIMAYPALLAAGYAVGAIALGAVLVRGATIGRRLGALAVGLAVLAAIGFVPIVGGVVGAAAALLGLGAFALNHAPPARPATPLPT